MKYFEITNKNIKFKKECTGVLELEVFLVM